MKFISLLIGALLFIQISVYPQIIREKTNEPIFFKVTSHDQNIKEIPAKSFYESKADWQYIIDTTWGPGLPLVQKQQIFNAYATAIRENFDGFQSLQMNVASWDSLSANYYNMIDNSTSKGGFSAIMSKFSMHLQDLHSSAYDESVVLSPLNPGIPILVISGFMRSVQHFGAVITALPDSSLLILRAVDNHPLDLEPGDKLLGYEGVPWKVLVNELLTAGLPAVGRWGGAQSAKSDGLLLGAGMNWHLFDTIDILKHSTGDTVHLSVAPLLNLPLIDMPNNEQLSVPGVSFPNLYYQQYVSHGIIDGTNIGYIYLCEEVQGISDQQFYEAVTALSETDALIIDMRLNYGGWAFFNNSLKILFNESHLTIEDAYRCNTNDFTLCPLGNSPTFKVPGNPPDFYDRPIAIFLGPTCVSMGDITAQRFRYHPTVRFFAKSSVASLGDNVFIANYPNWVLRYSISDMFHVNAPGEYLNRKEFPINYPVWFDPDDVANGYDTVVEEALEWINNLVYPHNIICDTTYYSPGGDEIQISTIIENPNSHQLSARGYIHNLDNELIDSLVLTKQTSTSEEEIWIGNKIAPIVEDVFKLSITTFDQTASTSYTLPNATRFTTAGPVVLDSVTYTKNFGNYYCRPYITNKGDSTLHNITGKLICNDAWVATINPSTWIIQTLSPDVSTPSIGALIVSVIDSLFPAYFNFESLIGCADWTYWEDTYQLVVGIEDETTLPTEYSLEQNYPNPFNPSTVISYQLPMSSDVVLKVFDVLGNEVATLVDEYKPAGKYEIELNSHSGLSGIKELPSGVYFYQLKADNFVETKKMLLIK